MQLYGGALDPSATLQELRREVIGQVEREVREGITYTFSTQYLKFRSLVLHAYTYNVHVLTVDNLNNVVVSGERKKLMAKIWDKISDTVFS